MRKQALTLLATTALATVATPAKRPWAARCAVWLLLKDPLCLSSEHKEALERMLVASPIVRQAYHFGQAFLHIVRERFSESLEPWLTAVQLYRISELMSLARGLTRDKAAVLVALTLPWSNGQTDCYAPGYWVLDFHADCGRTYFGVQFDGRTTLLYHTEHGRCKSIFGLFLRYIGRYDIVCLHNSAFKQFCAKIHSDHTTLFSARVYLTFSTLTQDPTYPVEFDLKNTDR